MDAVYIKDKVPKYFMRVMDEIDKQGYGGIEWRVFGPRNIVEVNVRWVDTIERGTMYMSSFSLVWKGEFFSELTHENTIEEQVLARARAFIRRCRGEKPEEEESE